MRKTRLASVAYRRLDYLETPRQTVPGNLPVNVTTDSDWLYLQRGGNLSEGRKGPLKFLRRVPLGAETLDEFATRCGGNLPHV